MRQASASIRAPVDARPLGGKVVPGVEPGKIDNFTVLDDDPYAVEPIKLKDIGVWGTVFEAAVFRSRGCGERPD